MSGSDRHEPRDRQVRSHVRAAFDTLWSYLVVEDELAAADPADALFCFGSRHRRVPEHAADLYHAGVAERVLVTGGPSRPGEETEAARFAGELARRGVPAERIVIEPFATNTGENVRLGLAELHRHGPVGRLVSVGWPLSARRCRATFERWAPHIEVLSAPALGKPGAVWTPNAELMRWALGELARLRRYDDFGFIVSQAVPPAVLDAALTLLAHLEAPPERLPSGSEVVAPTSAHDATRHGVEASRPRVVAEDSPLLDVETLSDLLGDRGGEIPVRLRPPARIEQVEPVAG